MSKSKLFLSQVIPSVLAFTLSGIYAIVDGFFVGNSVGDIGLSTINVAYPAVSLIQSIGIGIGMGGSVLYTISAATGERDKARRYMNATMELLLFSAVAVTALLLCFLPALLRLLGAADEIFTLGQQYLRIIIWGAAFQIFGTGLLPLLRNNGGANFAMGTMILGFAVNILLDYVFVWQLGWGVSGAAAATVIGQAITMIGAFLYLIRHRLPTGSFAQENVPLFGGILRLSIAPFGLNLSPIISLVFINKFSMMYGGEPAVACYACISYMLTILYYFIQGVGDGSQPLMSSYFGTGDWRSVRQIRRYAYLLAEALSAGGAAVLFFGRWRIGAIFGASDTVTALTAEALPIFLLGVLFLSFARIATASFYATANSLFSYILVYMEPLLLLLLLLFLPRLGGQTYIWWSMAGAQLLTSGIALLLTRLTDRRQAAGSTTS